MQAAVVNGFDSPPQYGTFAEPTPAQDDVLVHVTAAALSNLVKGQASGRHYSSEANFPFIPGSDGVGRLEDGSRVYLSFPKSPYGSMAELVAVPKRFTSPLPDELDDVTAAAIANPGMSSWAGLVERAKLVAGESVLINGATGVAGQLAIQVAKYHGARHIIATGRNREVLETLTTLGATAVIALEQPNEELEKAFRDAIRSYEVNVVLDYLWGPPAERIVAAIAGHGSPEGEPRIRFVQAGSMAGPTIALPGGALRSSGIELLGTGLGSLSYEKLSGAIGALLQAVVPGKFSIRTEAVPLSRVEAAWNKESGARRVVFTV